MEQLKVELEHRRKWRNTEASGVIPFVGGGVAVLLIQGPPLMVAIGALLLTLGATLAFAAWSDHQRYKYLTWSLQKRG